MMLQADSLDFSFRQKQVLCQVNLTLQSGDRLALLGPNGGGKSTLLQCLLGLLKTRRGSLLVDGQPLDLAPASLRALRQRVGLLFQDPDDQLLASRVAEDIALGPRNAGLASVEVEARVMRAASTLGIQELLPVFVDELSLGQKKRVALAGLLAQEPELLILDEPTAGLDWRGQQSLFETLEALGRLGVGLLVATHDLDFVWRWADQVALLEQGRILGRGTTAEVFERHSADFGCPILFALARRLFPERNPGDFRELQGLIRELP